jgi:hypothetical protein
LVEKEGKRSFADIFIPNSTTLFMLNNIYSTFMHSSLAVCGGFDANGPHFQRDQPGGAYRQEEVVVRCVDLWSAFMRRIGL